MSVIDFETFCSSVPPIHERGRLMCLDIGQKRVGVALSDRGWMIASPYRVLKREKFLPLAQEIIQIIIEEEVQTLIVGLPLELSGEEGRSVQSIRHFVYNLLKIRDIQVFYQDERFSTHAAQRTLLTADISRAKRRDVVDKMAASFILQGVLDALSYRLKSPV